MIHSSHLSTDHPPHQKPPTDQRNGGRRRGEEERLTDVNQRHLFGFPHKLEGNSKVLCFLDQHARSWVVSGEVGGRRGSGEGGEEGGKR